MRGKHLTLILMVFLSAPILYLSLYYTEGLIEFPIIVGVISGFVIGAMIHRFPGKTLAGSAVRGTLYGVGLLFVVVLFVMVFTGTSITDLTTSKGS